MNEKSACVAQTRLSSSISQSSATRKPLSRQLLINSITRNIKGAHFAVGCDCWDHHLPKRSAVMNQEKYIGMDVHQATISVAVMDSSGKLIMECILETKAATIHASKIRSRNLWFVASSSLSFSRSTLRFHSRRSDAIGNSCTSFRYSAKTVGNSVSWRAS